MWRGCRLCDLTSPIKSSLSLLNILRPTSSSMSRIFFLHVNSFNSGVISSERVAIFAMKDPHFTVEWDDNKYII